MALRRCKCDAARRLRLNRRVVGIAGGVCARENGGRLDSATPEADRNLNLVGRTAADRAPTRGIIGVVHIYMLRAFSIAGHLLDLFCSLSDTIFSLPVRNLDGPESTRRASAMRHESSADAIGAG